jgi:hypothetical protein
MKMTKLSMSTNPKTGKKSCRIYRERLDYGGRFAIGYYDESLRYQTIYGKSAETLAKRAKRLGFEQIEISESM